MPNWCSGDVSFYGSLDDLEKLEKQARQGTLTSHSMTYSAMSFFAT